MKEIRNNEIINSTGSESRLVEGYAVVFNSRSQLLRDKNGEPFYEEIEPNALNGVIERSDVVCLLNHDMNRGVLARSRKGEGSLTLSLDSRGLKFSFQAPNSSLGDEILEYIKRKDITQCSFGFTIQDDEFVYTDNSIIPLRKIHQIDFLYDISLVFTPAYEATSVDLRGLNLSLINSNSENNENNVNVQMNEETRNQNELEPSLDVENRNDQVTDSEENKEENEQNEESREAENNSDEENETSDNEQSEEKEENSNDCKDEKNEERNLNNNPNININHSTMKKEFNLLRNINNIVNGKELDEVAKSLTIEGRSQSNKVGVSSNGQIVIPFEIEKRFEDTPNGIIASQTPVGTVEGFGGEAVETVKTDLLGSIKQKMVLSDLGCRWFNLTSNVEIPLYDEGNKAYWESEISEAREGNGKFRLVKLSPKRVSTVMYISKQWAMQTSPSANAVLMDEITYSIARKLQETLLGNGNADDVTPAGIFNGVSVDSDDVDFASVVAMEELLEARGYSDYKYLASPSAKAVLRTTVKGRNANAGFIMMNNEIEGREVLSTGDVTPKGLICGDFSQMAIASFGGLDITINPYSYARTNQIEIVVTGYFDVATIRDNAFVKRILK